MAFDKNKRGQTATKVADNLNDLCKKLNTAMERKKDLKASKFIEMYDKCCILRSQLESLVTKLLDSGNTKEFEYVANISHRSSKILNSFEKLTSRPIYQPSFSNMSSANPMNAVSSSGNLGMGAGNAAGGSFGAPASASFEDFANFDANPLAQPNVSKKSSNSDWARFDDFSDAGVDVKAVDPFGSDAKPAGRNSRDTQSSTAHHGARAPFVDERRYKRDYLDSNMDTSVDYFNTSMDLHNFDDDFYQDHGYGPRESDPDGYPLHPDSDPFEIVTPQPARPSAKAGPNNADRDVPRARPNVRRDAHDRATTARGADAGLKGHPRDGHTTHDRTDRQADRVSVGRMGVREDRAGDKTRERVSEDVLSPDFIVKTKLKQAGNGSLGAKSSVPTGTSLLGSGSRTSSAGKPGSVSAQESDMVEYIKMLEKFLQLTKFSRVITDLDGQDYAAKLASLQHHYRESYDSLPAPGNGSAFQHARAAPGHSAAEAVPDAHSGGAQLALVSPGKQAFKDESKLFGKEIEPLWRAESDGGLSNYLGDFLLRSDYNLLRTNKYEVHLDLNQLNRDEFVLNLQLYFVARINIASLSLVYISGAAGTSSLPGQPPSSATHSSRLASGTSAASMANGYPPSASSIALVDERPLLRDDNFTINLKVDLDGMVDFPVLHVKLIENDGNKSELRLLLPIGLFLSLVPLKYNLDQFEAYWNSMELTVNRQIRLFLSKLPVDLNNLINLLWKFFSVYLQEDVLLLSSCGTEVLLGSVFIKQNTLIIVQLRSICNNLLTSTMNLLKEVFSSLSIKYDSNISNYTLKRVSALPLSFQSNLQLNTVVKSISNYQ